MIHSRKPLIMGTASLIALVTFVQQGHAMTAQEVWDSWQQFAETYGETINVEQITQTPDGLVLSGVSYAMGEDGFGIAGEASDIFLTEQADGSVLITGAEETVVAMTTVGEDGEVFEMTFLQSLPDMEVLVTNISDGVAFDYSILDMGFEIIDATLDGAAFPLSMIVDVGVLEGSYSQTMAAPSFGVDYSVIDTSVQISARNPEDASKLEMELILDSIVGTARSKGSMESDKGVDAQGSTLFGPMDLHVDVSESPDAFVLDLLSEGGNGSGQVSDTQMTYNVNYNPFEVSVSGAKIPLPEVSFSVGGISTTLMLPLAKSSVPQPFLFKTALTDFAIGTSIWNMIDPAEILPRIPASLVIDVAGLGNWFVDILDPEVTASDDIPGEIHALSISEVLLELAGARLEAQGNFTFDNSDLTTFDGMPRPTGALDITLIGVNALVDRLVQMGLLPADQAMGLRMMSGMILRPGNGEDTLVSKIEISPDGRVLANGQALPF